MVATSTSRASGRGGQAVRQVTSRRRRRGRGRDVVRVRPAHVVLPGGAQGRQEERRAVLGVLDQVPARVAAVQVAAAKLLLLLLQVLLLLLEERCRVRDGAAAADGDRIVQGGQPVARRMLGHG